MVTHDSLLPPQALMNASLPFPIAVMMRDSYGVGQGPHASAVDGVALFLLGLVFGVLGTVAAIIWSTKRRNRNRAPLEIDDLLPDSSPSPSSEPQRKSPASQPQKPWEKSGDWWKS
jgi:hypothetical protein